MSRSELLPNILEQPHPLSQCSDTSALPVLENGFRPSIADGSLEVPPPKTRDVLSTIYKARNIVPADVCSYINPGEELVGFGNGGSESLVLFLKVPNIPGVVVRKILSEKLSATDWNPHGIGTMVPPFVKARLQVHYLQALPKDVAQYFPLVYGMYERQIPRPIDYRGSIARQLLEEVIIDQSYVPGIEVSTFIAHFQPPPQIVAHLYKEIFRLLKAQIHTHRRQPLVKPTLETSYFHKIEQRIELSRKMTPNIFTRELLESEELYINDQKYLNILPLLERFRRLTQSHALLEPPFHCLTIGDTNTENIKICNIEPILYAMKAGNTNFTYSDIDIRFLDPRAIGFESCGGETIDDYIYDTKPFHNSLGNYDVIHGEHFSLDIQLPQQIPHITITHNQGHPFQKSYANIEQYFRLIVEEGWGVNQAKFLEQDPYWLIRFLFLMGTHFAAMTPFHLQREVDGSFIDNISYQKRPLALYCEGVKWLNRAYDMLTGKLTEFYGIPVMLPHDDMR